MLADYGADFFADLMIGHISPVTTWYVALLTEIPYPSIDGTDLADYEVVDASYERKAMAESDFDDSSGGVVSSNVAITWDAAVDNWSEVVGYALVDDATAGNVYVFGEFPESMIVVSGQYLSIPAGMISIGLSTTEAGNDD